MVLILIGFRICYTFQLVEGQTLHHHSFESIQIAIPNGKMTVIHLKALAFQKVFRLQTVWAHVVRHHLR